MYKRLLVPTDGTERSALALETALRLARKGGATVVGLHAGGAPRPPGADGEAPAEAAWRRQCEQQACDALAYVTWRAREAGVASECVLARDTPPWRAIIDGAHEHGCDLIVMASHGRHGLAALLLGSETQKVLTHCAIPVLIVR